MDKAEESFKKALKNNPDDHDKAMAYSGLILFNMKKKDKNWFDECETNLHKALSMEKNLVWPYYFFGFACKEDYRFRLSEDNFKKVVELNQIFVEESDAELKKINKIARAMPVSIVGKKLALEPEITRGDICAIFVHELKMEKTFEKYHKKSSELLEIPEDIKQHPLKTDITIVLNYGLRGLETDHSNMFHPDRKIKRVELAMMLEDIITMISGNEENRNAYMGCTSPFPDVDSSYAFFNSLITVSSKGLMSADDILSGNFNPDGYVSGADSLLIMSKIREKLKF